jgi:hypothetical protein
MSVVDLAVKAVVATVAMHIIRSKEALILTTGDFQISE